MSTPNIFAMRMAAAAAVNGGAPPVATAPTIPAPGNGHAAPPPSTPVAAPVQQAVAAPPAPTRTLPAGAPGWARAECGACEGRGFNTRGNVCRPCAGHAATAGRALPEWFETGYQDGEAYWEVKAEFAEQVEKTLGSRGAGGSIRIAPATAAQVQSRTQVPAQAPATAVPTQAAAPTAAPFVQAVPPTPAPAPAAPAAPQGPSAAVPATTAAPAADGGRSRAKKSFTLYLDCAPLGEAAIMLEDVFHRHAQTLAAAAQSRGQQDRQGNPIQSYWQLDAFARRDALAAVAEQIVEVEKFGTKAVVAATDTPDHRAFAAAFRPLADRVVSSTRA